MSPRKYNELLDKSIQMEYKKANPQATRDIRTSHQKIVEDLELQNRVFRTTEREPFITIKDHKPQFQHNTKTRLINKAGNWKNCKTNYRKN
jgi:hypothetical protein